MLDTKNKIIFLIEVDIIIYHIPDASRGPATMGIGYKFVVSFNCTKNNRTRHASFQLA